MRIRVFVLSLVVAVFASPSAPAIAQQPQTASRCLALAENVPRVQYASLNTAALSQFEVKITFVGHATFRIESAGGVIIATDDAGYAGPGPVPDVVTMNHAHSTHYTNNPDPAIDHVLRGWGSDGKPAKHSLTVKDVFIRNVTTDIRGWGGVREKDGNSIFIFEVADLCIGHLGHLHHTLGPEYLGLIGQLDVVMVPVDGSYTMAQPAMMKVLELLKARLILPMHYFSQNRLQTFLNQVGDGYDVEVNESSSITVTAASLPAKPTVMVLPGPELHGFMD
ncbi:MBL fold metallo-hydrolase [Dichotomicrobium thermohalophilum]|uniref:L-ascorbate metabolism protein UlaG (Beta-lactamase superfamily) n=1 Tax=Dichotomicrobium thermohalophilum TaxID=933063 RepID=A0A397Q3P7_9HYPH|nr:MBL fold metallo-hydrolase [Dichotomicrobium thermohalophilum]RIA55742.1 L-ascorbate metabolism protein UlaG (beta-lactamase superfamily) [Dichotomicrobium thermohalophilum]